MTTPKASRGQIELANLFQIDVSTDTFYVATARLLDRVAEEIGVEPSKPSTDRQRSYADSLGLDVTNDSKRVASAKINDTCNSRNREAIASLNLQVGDNVNRTTEIGDNEKLPSPEKDFVVSSIQTNGRVFFKGGRGQAAWAAQLKKTVGKTTKDSKSTSPTVVGHFQEE